MIPAFSHYSKTIGDTPEVNDVLFHYNTKQGVGCFSSGAYGVTHFSYGNGILNYSHLLGFLPMELVLRSHL